ncbi:hypothetical protein B0J14DRAFT_604703 [Halenospora varia]|nr:hypothetical protein B0J14DRAFT_604703 [Halenospora varia]
MPNFTQHQQINGVNQDYTGTHTYIQPTRLEHNQYGESQIQPLPSSYQAQAHLRPGPPLAGSNNESGLEPAIAVLSLQLKWERLLAQERNVSRGLNQFSNNLQIRLHECEAVSIAKDTRIKNLEDENDRLCKAINNSQLGCNDGSNALVVGTAVNSGNGAIRQDTVGTQDETRTPTTLSDYRSATDFSPSALMLPPLQTAGSRTAVVPSKRKSDSPTSPLTARKRSTQRAATHPASPRPAFNPSKTPSPLDPFRITW